MVSSLFSIYLFIVNNFKCNYCTIYNSCRPMLKPSSVIVANLQEMVYFNMAEYSPSFVPNYVHVMWIYFVFTMCGMFTNFETVWNGYLMDMTLFYGLFMTRCL